MIESLASGTPIIARARGSVLEVIEHGTTGLVVESIGQAQRAIEEIQQLSRKRCREVFEERFSAVRMAQNYEAVYTKLIRNAAGKPADNFARAA
jgi:glycosyltransferase involved in cell wall biosynthesis